MFPIHSESGQVIAFGGRALRADDQPKYLNSPETKIYKKSSVLYNLHRAKIDARKHDRMILVEGYMDVIGVYSAGIKEVVASSGTSLSIDQVRSIKRQTSQQQAGNGQVILNFDPDAAGQRSAEKYVSAFLAEGLRVRVLNLPGGLDPDEYIQQHGIDGYSAQLQRAPSFFHWLAERARERFDISTAEGRADAFKFVLPAAQLVHDRVERAAIASEITEMLKLDRDVVAEQLRLSAKRSESKAPIPPTSTIPPNEVLLLTCFVLSEDAREVISGYLQSRDVLGVLDCRPVFEAASRLTTFSLAELSTAVDPRFRTLLAHLSFNDCGIREEDAPEQALHCLRALERRAAHAEQQQLQNEIRKLEQQGDVTGAIRLMEQLERLKGNQLGS
jgi:DNA primase